LQSLATEAGEVAQRWRANNADRQAEHIEKLASYARRSNSATDIVDFLAALGGRENDHGWQPISKDPKLSPTLRACSTVHEAAFYLDAIVTEFQWSKEYPK